MTPTCRPPTGGAVLNGSSWALAFQDLQDALDEAATRLDTPSERQIFVARGTYKPTKLPTGSTDPRDASFLLPTNTQLYGGYLSGEDLTTRSGKFRETVLSGDIGTPMVRSDNAYSVVTIEPGAPTPTRIDGFAILDGHADGSGVNVPDNPKAHGGGIYCYDAHMILRNSYFQANVAKLDGGAVYFFSPATSLPFESFRAFNTYFFSNLAQKRGGGIFTFGTNPITEESVSIPSYAYHCTFHRNYAGTTTSATPGSDGGAGAFLDNGSGQTAPLDTVPLSPGVGLPANFVLANNQFFDNVVYGGGAALRVDVQNKYLVSNTFAYNQVLGGTTGPGSTTNACSIYAEGASGTLGYMVSSIAYDTVDSTGALNTVDAIDGPGVVTGPTSPGNPRLEAFESDIFVTGPGVYWTPPTFPTALQNVDVAPGFVSGPGRNFRLSAASPLLDKARDQIDLPPDYPDADEDGDRAERVPKITYLIPGEVRVVDDGVAGPTGQLLDFGAFERQ